MKDKFVAVCDKKKKSVNPANEAAALWLAEMFTIGLDAALFLKRLFAVGKKMQGCKLSTLIGTELLVRYQRDELCRRISSKAT